MTNNFSTAANAARNTQATEILSDAELEAVSGGDRDWRDDYHLCSAGTVGGGSPGLYPLYIRCR